MDLYTFVNVYIKVYEKVLNQDLPHKSRRLTGQSIGKYHQKKARSPRP